VSLLRPHSQTGAIRRSARSQRIATEQGELPDFTACGPALAGRHCGALQGGEPSSRGRRCASCVQQYGEVHAKKRHVWMQNAHL